MAEYAWHAEDAMDACPGLVCADYSGGYEAVAGTAWQLCNVSNEESSNVSSQSNNLSSDDLETVAIA